MLRYRKRCEPSPRGRKTNVARTPLNAPELLTEAHEFSDFSCGEANLDQWLQRRARANQISGASRTFVVCEGKRVVAFYALASSVIAQAEATGRFKRNMPDPIPVVVLARLAIDQNFQGQGLGRALFQDAARRIIFASEVIGIRGLIVHTLTESAKAFYLALGMECSPIEPMILMVTLSDLRAAC